MVRLKDMQIKLIIEFIWNIFMLVFLLLQSPTFHKRPKSLGIFNKMMTKVLPVGPVRTADSSCGKFKKKTGILLCCGF